MKIQIKEFKDLEKCNKFLSKIDRHHVIKIDPRSIQNYAGDINSVIFVHYLVFEADLKKKR